MAYTTINKPNQYFNTVLYTGNGGTQSVTGVGFKPDFVWLKNRVANYSNNVRNAVTGNGPTLITNTTDAEADYSANFTSFNVDGFSLAGGLGGLNLSSDTYVAWNWLANNTSGSTNTAGTVTSTVAANTTSGFSIVSFTTIAGGNATIGHGLGSVPKMIIMKARTTTYNWDIYHVSTGNANRLIFTTAASAATPCWGSTTPTSSVFTMDQSFYGSGIPTIAYCFAEIKGYSKFASYTGNGSTNGTFVYTGFKPAYIMIKRTNSTGDWAIFDSARNPINSAGKALWADLSDAEATYNDFDILSNGFKLRFTSTTGNGSGDTYIYMAFAENPFVSSTLVPTTAR